MTKTENVHGTGLVLGKAGVLLRGPSGAGKSILALALIDRWQGRGEPAFLVSDDRVDLTRQGEGLVMNAPATIAGLIEMRGRGIVRRPHADGAPLHLVVDLVPQFDRMPEEDMLVTRIAGIELARAPVPQAGVIGLGHQVLLVVEAVADLSIP